MAYDSRTSPLKPGVALNQIRETRLSKPPLTHELRDSWRAQGAYEQRLSSSLARNPRLSEAAARNLLRENTEIGIQPGVRRAISDITVTDREVRVDPAFARAAIGLRMVGSAALGASFGAAAGVESGPGVLAIGLAGGIVGAVAGDRLMDAMDRSRIYDQRGSDGNLWQMDPRQPEQGWTRLAHPGEFGTEGPTHAAAGGPPDRSLMLRADSRLTDELNYKASSVAVELALAHPAKKQPPYVQPAGPGDASAPAASPWVRDPATGRWNRDVSDPTMAAMAAMEIATGALEQATPERNAQLDRAAQATIRNNEAQSPQAIADRFRSAYEAYGCNRHGQMPTAVIEAPRPALGLDELGHPGHGLFRQAQAGMRAIDAKMGRSSDQQTDNMAAWLAISACREGLTRIDHVSWATDRSRFFAVQGPLNSPFKTVIPVSPEGAMIPLQETSQQWEQAKQQRADHEARSAAERPPQDPSQLHMEGAKVRR